MAWQGFAAAHWRLATVLAAVASITATPAGGQTDSAGFDLYEPLGAFFGEYGVFGEYGDFGEYDGGCHDCSGGCHMVFDGCIVRRCLHCCDPLWYAEADALFLDRTRTRAIKLVEDHSDSSSGSRRGQKPALLSTDALSFDYQWGPQITVGRRLDARRRVAATYFGLHHWRATRTLIATEAPANLSLPFDTNYTSDLDGATDVAVSYTSRLHSVELSYLLDRSSVLTHLIGFRYFHLDEGFDYRSTDDGETSDYLIDTSNDLVGLQLGAQLDYQVSDRWSWNFDVKAGMYVNFASQRTWLGDDNNTIVLRDVADSEGELAFLGELRAGIGYQLAECVVLTAGYQITWVEGVALAPEQLDFTTTAASGSALNHHGGAFYDGGYVGLGIVR